MPRPAPAARPAGCSRGWAASRFRSRTSVPSRSALRVEERGGALLLLCGRFAPVREDERPRDLLCAGGTWPGLAERTDPQRRVTIATSGRCSSDRAPVTPSRIRPRVCALERIGGVEALEHRVAEVPPDEDVHAATIDLRRILLRLPPAGNGCRRQLREHARRDRWEYARTTHLGIQQPADESIESRIASASIRWRL